MKKLISLFTALMLLSLCAFAAAEDPAGILTINLSTATDEELADAAAQIKA